MFAMFFLSEYNNILVMSAVFCLLFLGGWALPTFGFESLYTFVGAYSSFVFSFKVIGLSILFIVIRATLPRYRYDQLMSIG